MVGESVNRAWLAVASACHSVGRDDGAEAGAAGGRSPLRAEQQDGGAQLAGSNLQHVQALPETADAYERAPDRISGAAATAPRRTESKIATNVLTVLAIRNMTGSFT